MNELDRYAARLPALGVMATIIQQDLREIFDDTSEAATVTVTVMDRGAMAAALTLPYNPDAHAVEDQIKATVYAPALGSAMVIARVGSNYRIIEATERPTVLREAKRTALICLLPTHLGPRNWDSVKDAPTSFTIEVAAA
jgi:hypothetical protein